MDDLVHGLAAFILSPDGDRVVAGAETEDDGHAGRGPVVLGSHSRFPFFAAAPGRLLHHRKGPSLNLITVQEPGAHERGRRTVNRLPFPSRDSAVT
jgi:hypothetical protein